MAEVHGNGGSITFTNVTAGVKSWTLNWAADTHDITDFADGTARTFKNGLTSWTASCECNYDATNTADIEDAAATLTLIVGGAVQYSGSALMTSMDVSTSVDGIVTMTYGFQGSGTLTPAYS